MKLLCCILLVGAGISLIACTLSGKGKICTTSILQPYQSNK